MAASGTPTAPSRPLITEASGTPTGRRFLKEGGACRPPLSSDIFGYTLLRAASSGERDRNGATCCALCVGPRVIRTGPRARGGDGRVPPARLSAVLGPGRPGRRGAQEREPAGAFHRGGQGDRRPAREGTGPGAALAPRAQPVGRAEAPSRPAAARPDRDRSGAADAGDVRRAGRGSGGRLAGGPTSGRGDRVRGVRPRR